LEYIRLVREPAGSPTSPGEFAAIGGKFQYFLREVVWKLRFLNNSIVKILLKISDNVPLINQ
jgi:hypothetical protein